MNKRISIITGSRAEYGLLSPLIKLINTSNNFHMDLIVTGTHLSPFYGNTYKEIINDGFKISAKVNIKIDKYNKDNSIINSIGLSFNKFAKVYDKLKPELIFILGDRYEMISPAYVALIKKIPLFHIHGGEVTTGSYDDTIRHCLTKISSKHFVANTVYKKRVVQLGENPKNIFVVGGMGIDKIKNTFIKGAKTIENYYNIKFHKYNYLITYHPETANNKTDNIEELFKALDQQKKSFYIFTGVNSDSGGIDIRNKIIAYVKKNKNKSIFIESMGSVNYLSTMKIVNGVIGNSSSGIVEAPFFKKPTINIGSRQNGRIQAKSIINCNLEKSSILAAMNKANSKKFLNSLKFFKNPYGLGNSSLKILNILNKKKTYISDKKFYDL
jgi:GDP/UDP-N,N'-diacetylbacillosamine 2-epimerase (hydrolysing)